MWFGLENINDYIFTLFPSYAVNETDATLLARIPSPNMRSEYLKKIFSVDVTESLNRDLK